MPSQDKLFDMSVEEINFTNGGMSSGQVAAYIGVAAALTVITGGIGGVALAGAGLAYEGLALGGAATAAGTALGTAAGAIGFAG